MSKGPLFSTYRQGENRVTASMLAVFERIDLALVERLLGAASGESELQMVSFQNQVAGDDSVPDARIEANFRYLFEVKTEREWVDVDQLQRHLANLTGDRNEYLFVVTPDVNEPEDVRSLRVEDARVSWFSFAQLADAIQDAIAASDTIVFEHQEVLLRELIRLFEEDGLLDSPGDTVIVAGTNAHGFYLRYNLYVRQTERSVRQQVRNLGFYSDWQIHREVPSIRWRQDHVDVSLDSAERFAKSDEPCERLVGEALLDAIGDGNFGEGGELQVFLLTKPDAEQTLRLTRPIRHDGDSAWTQNQRYVSSAALRVGPATTADLLTA